MEWEGGTGSNYLIQSLAGILHIPNVSVYQEQEMSPNPGGVGGSLRISDGIPNKKLFFLLP